MLKSISSDIKSLKCRVFRYEANRSDEKEIDYLETIQAQIELAEPKDLQDIELELEKGGYLETKNKAKEASSGKSKPETFVASDGTEISVGKNNYQNDRLTLKTAKRIIIGCTSKTSPALTSSSIRILQATKR